MKINKGYVKKFIAMMFVAIIIGAGIEGVNASVRYFKAGNTGQLALGIENVETINMQKEEEGYSFKEGENIVVWKLNGDYINKFEYFYHTDAYIAGYADVYTYDIYGNPCQKRIEDSMIAGMYRSVLNINGKVDRIELHYDNTEANAVISDALIDNGFKYNPYIALFIATVCFIILFLIGFRKVYVEHIEWAFFVCALAIGGFLVLTTPAYPVGWDEEIHFLRAYEMGNTGANESSVQYLNNTHVMYKLSAPHQTFEERIDAMKCVTGQTGIPSNMEKTYRFNLKFITYLPQALIFMIGRSLSVPFYISWVLGKAMNLILYSMVVFWAIRKIPVAKYLMAVIALVPTAIFQASCFTYDAAVIACSLFGTAIIIKGFLDKEEKLSQLELIGFLTAMIIVSLSKAVYAPLFFVALFIPETAYVSKKQCRYFRCITVLLFLTVIGLMILPSIINPAEVGDTRGGATSESGQISYIFGHPFAYAVVLLSNIGKTLFSYTVGDEGMCIMGHYGVAQYNIDILMAIFVLFVLITDTYYKYDIKEKTSTLMWKIKGIFLVMILIMVAFIWTALYISFTEVGAIQIAGVQGRYYLPIIFATLLLLRGDYLKNNMNKETYQLIVLGGISLITMFVVLSVIVIPSCL